MADLLFCVMLKGLSPISSIRYVSVEITPTWKGRTKRIKENALRSLAFSEFIS